MFDVRAPLTIEGTDFLSNTAAESEGGGAYIRLVDEGEMLRMDRVRMESNRAGEGGSALYLGSLGAQGPRARGWGTRPSSVWWK